MGLVDLSCRVDVLAKLSYAKNFFSNSLTRWDAELYLEHLRILNGFVENRDGGTRLDTITAPKKIGPSEFVVSFQELMTGIKENGFRAELGAIPIGKNGVILGGAHRLATCIALGIAPPFYFDERYGEVDEPIYSFSYFEKRGLSPQYLDFLRLQYVLWDRDCTVVLIFPVAGPYQGEAKRLLEMCGNVVSESRYEVSAEFGRAITVHAYQGAEWIGDWSNNWAGSDAKARPCFGNGGHLTALIIRGANAKSLVNAKTALRKLYKVANHSVHMTDSWGEALVLAKALFNPNSRQFLTLARNADSRWFHRLFAEYRDLYSNNHGEKLCIDGSSVMAAYGIRDARDLDYLSTTTDLNASGYKEIANHNHESGYYGQSISEIVSDPRNHFYYLGCKFASISLVQQWKLSRGEPKDLIDAKAIDKFLASAGNYARIKPRITFRSMYSSSRLLALKGRFFLSKWNKALRKRILLSQRWTTKI